MISNLRRMYEYDTPTVARRQREIGAGQTASQILGLLGSCIYVIPKTFHYEVSVLDMGNLSFGHLETSNKQSLFRHWISPETVCHFYSRCTLKL